jgi:hypothetical protein
MMEQNYYAGIATTKRKANKYLRKSNNGILRNGAAAQRIQCKACSNYITVISNKAGDDLLYFDFDA